MKHHARLTRRGFREQTDATSAPVVDPRRAEHIRIARAFLGVTPAQLATEIGISTPTPLMAGATRPAHTFDALSSALQVVIGWYHDELGGTSRVLKSVADNAFGLDVLIPEYLTLRAKWEDRGARRVVARLNQQTTTPAAPAAALPPTDHQAMPARRRALLVDDTSDVVVSIGAFLDGFGFDVTSSSNGDDALRILATGEPFDLLVTDHAMPGLTGRDLAILACQTRPSLRVLIITGYPESVALTTLPAGVMLLAKPFRRAELGECLERLLATEEQFPIIPTPVRLMADAAGGDRDRP